MSVKINILKVRRKMESNVFYFFSLQENEQWRKTVSHSRRGKWIRSRVRSNSVFAQYYQPYNVRTELFSIISVRTRPKRMVLKIYYPASSRPLRHWRMPRNTSAPKNYRAMRGICRKRLDKFLHSVCVFRCQAPWDGNYCTAHDLRVKRSINRLVNLSTASLDLIRDGTL